MESIFGSTATKCLALGLMVCIGLFYDKPNLISPPDDGERLARAWCGSCHQYPEPAILDRATWSEQVMPRMALYLGHYPDESVRAGLFEHGVGGHLVREADIFPEKPRLSAADLEKIKAFYQKNAPQHLTNPQTAPLPSTLNTFHPRFPSAKIAPPGTSMLRFATNGSILVGDAYSQKLLVFDRHLQLLRAGQVGEGVVWADEQPDALWLTVMGSFAPTDEPSGFLLQLDTQTGAGQVLADGLQRPVHTALGDLNGDGQQDAVVCEFGRYTGRLTWLEASGDSMRRHTLLTKPGATKAYIRDLNGDGHPDVAALFAQGDEGIWFFYNDGKGRFTPENVLRFSPAYGSSFFDFADFDGDGRDDILYTNGDNADFKPVLKPYHGIRIFRNLSKNRFRETFFHPMHGAYGAALRDFDLDGDLDIAAISFFPDFAQKPAEGFALLENDGQNRFTATTFTGAERGRWIVMDTGDPDGDGDTDILLGSMTFEVPQRADLVQQWTDAGLPFIFLENTTR